MRTKAAAAPSTQICRAKEHFQAAGACNGPIASPYALQRHIFAHCLERQIPKMTNVTTPKADSVSTDEAKPAVSTPIPATAAATPDQPAEHVPAAAQSGPKV